MTDYRELNKDFTAAMKESYRNDNSVTDRIKLVEAAGTQETLSKYLYPTMIILPIVVVVILILASKAHIAIKIITIILLVLVIAVYHLQQNNIDLLKYFSSNSSDVPN
jgi:Flp pilus assembly protein TadB